MSLMQVPQFDPMQVGQVFAQSGMFPDTRDAAQCATKLIVGQGLGLTPYDSMAGLHVIKGKVVLAANLMAAAIKRSGKYDYRTTTTEEKCTVTIYDVRKEEPRSIGSTTWTMADAKNAGLGGDNWRKYPKAMLFARCISAAYREHCPDALGNAPVYVEAQGETELGVTIEEHQAEMAALPSSSPPPSQQGGGTAPTLQVEKKPVEKAPGASNAQPTKIELDVEFTSQAGKPYKKHFVHLDDSTKVACFSNAKSTRLVNEIRDAMDRGDTIEVLYEESKFGKDLTGYNIVELEVAADLEAPKPETKAEDADFVDTIPF